MAMALHAFFEKYRIKTRKKIHIHYRITNFKKSVIFAITPIFVIMYVAFFRSCHKLHFRPKFKIVLTFVVSQSRYVMKIQSWLAELQFTLF